MSAADEGVGERFELDVTGPIWEWRGPAPFHFVTVPAPQSEDIRADASALSYGWGMIPVTVTIGQTTWTTSLWPKDGGYVIPLKDRVRAAEGLALDDVVTVQISIDLAGGMP